MSFCFDFQAIPTSLQHVHALAAGHLHGDELALLSSRATPKRIAEFVAGRVAAHKAINRLLERDSIRARFSILREGDGPTGCPQVFMPVSAHPPRVSISHADGLAVAASAHGKIGIDIAAIEPQAPSFINETFSPRELEAWAKWLASDPTSAVAITTAFAAKEAALKWLGTGFGLPLKSIQITPGPHMQQTVATPLGPAMLYAMTLSGPGTLEMRAVTGSLLRVASRVVVLLVERDRESGPQIGCTS
jgi:phosphopantetheinyl transferase